MESGHRLQMTALPQWPGTVLSIAIFLFLVLQAENQRFWLVREGGTAQSQTTSLLFTFQLALFGLQQHSNEIWVLFKEFLLRLC